MLNCCDDLILLFSFLGKEVKSMMAMAMRTMLSAICPSLANKLKKMSEDQMIFSHFYGEKTDGYNLSSVMAFITEENDPDVVIHDDEHLIINPSKGLNSLYFYGYDAWKEEVILADNMDQPRILLRLKAY